MKTTQISCLRLATAGGGAALLALATLCVPPPAGAQVCDRALCRSGETYRPSSSFGPNSGLCESRSGLGYTSRTPTSCAEGWTLEAESGRCILDACSSCGGEAPLCDPDERYTGATTQDGRAAGRCHHGPDPVTQAESFQIKPCRDGFTLIEETGMCRRDCTTLRVIDFPVVFPVYFGPDLTIRRAWLRDGGSGEITTRVPTNEPYWVCFEVANIGTTASGPFNVRGGGLGVSFNPRQRHAGLRGRASRQGCVAYPTAPSPGSYRLALEADANEEVTETREGNNDAIVAVIVE